MTPRSSSSQLTDRKTTLLLSSESLFLAAYDVKFTKEISSRELKQFRTVLAMAGRGERTHICRCTGCNQIKRLSWKMHSISPAGHQGISLHRGRTTARRFNGASTRRKRGWADAPSCSARTGGSKEMARRRGAEAVGVAMVAVSADLLRGSAQYAWIERHLAEGNRLETGRSYKAIVPSCARKFISLRPLRSPG